MNIYADADKLKELKAKANRLPKSPGVYIMKNSGGKIIYIGKAKALKNRVTQYFGSGNQHTEKVKRMVGSVDDFEYIICDSEFEALVLENSLIKQNLPKYNILLKDDKGYHYIKITKEKWRRIETANQISDDGTYIGPYYSSYIVKDTLDEVRKIFRLPDCNRSFDKYSKPCLNYHIDRCFAPCKGNISFEEYNSAVNSAIEFIKHGNTKKFSEEMKVKMLEASERLDFETAAKLRDRINAVKKFSERQKVVMCSYKSQDVFSGVILGEKACVSVFIFRNRRLTDKQHFIIEGITDIKELYAEFLLSFYSDKEDIPPRILLDSEPDDLGILKKFLSEKAEHAVSIISPKAGEQKALCDMCRKNASDNLALNLEKSGKYMTGLGELAHLLNLEKLPKYIEAYDISNTAGEENVAGMVVFKDGKPFKEAYKKFRIKSFLGQDDYRSLAEVLDRRFCEYETSSDKGFKTLPDLILLDGGKGQVSAVLPVLKKHNISVPIFGMVKDSKHRTRAISASGGDLTLKSNRQAYTFITTVQDEVHRFAIGYHRKKRTQKMLDSELTKIPGIGEKKAALLLKSFKTVSAVRQADISELEKIKGINKDNSENIYNFYHSDK